MKLSIVIAVRNDPVRLRRTLANLEGQQDAPWHDIELVVQDGASTDDTRDVAVASDLDLHLMSESDAGIYDGMNRGAARATGDWLQFLNAGDFFHSPEGLRDLVDALRISKQRWAISRALNMTADPRGPVEIPSFPHRKWRHAYGVRPHCHQATWFSRRAFWDEGGHRLDLGLAADHHLLMRFAFRSKPDLLQHVVIEYEGGGVSAQRSAEIPGLLRDNRVDFFELGPIGRYMDSVAQQATRSYLAGRSRVGRTVRGFLSARRYG